MGVAIELKGVSKSFKLRRNAALNLKLKAIGLFNPRYREYVETFWALSDVDLAVPEGEFLGLIGHNGAGKSTLLRLLAGIFPPTRGQVVVRGRVAPMIELGVGFHPDLTGRENVYLSTSLCGLSSRETDLVLPLIVEFSELEAFIDLPVKNYSSGMYMRLGFAITVHLDLDILLVDEVLAVGDERFQQKCFARMAEIRAQGKTIVLVSHDLALIERLADRACLVMGGRLLADGPPAETVSRYRELVAVPVPAPAH